LDLEKVKKEENNPVDESKLVSKSDVKKFESQLIYYPSQPFKVIQE